MSPSRSYAQRLMRVNKLQRDDPTGDVVVSLVPVTGRPGSRPTDQGVVIYGVSLLYRRVAVPELDAEFEVMVDVP